MSGVKRVLIHQIFGDIANLADTLDHFCPDYVFLISCVPKKRSEPQHALDLLQHQTVALLGNNVVNVEYSELIGIEEAWHNSTMMEVFRVLGEIKEKCEEMAGEDDCEYYAGLSDSGDGGELITVGISFAAVLHDMKTYYTRARKPYYNEYVVEIENLNKITETKNWLESQYSTSKNLRYLRQVIKFEEQGVGQISAAKIADLDGFETRSTHLALNKLVNKGLINKEGKRNYTVSSTDLGKLTIKAWYPFGNDE